MIVFVDTSAFLATLNPGDSNHRRAGSAWEALIQREERLITTNYVVLETISLTQRRHGIPFVRGFQQRALPILSIHWVDEAIHTAGTAAVLAANRQQLSLVDCTSFETMRRLGIGTAFAFDEHFPEQGFTCIPQQGQSS